MISWLSALPWVLLSIVLSAGAGLWGGYKFGHDAATTDLLAKQQANEEGRQTALEASAKEIAKVKVVNQTIRQETQREIVERPVYRDCVLPDSGLQLINQALTGNPGVPAGSGSVPGVGAPDR